jgi:hypothetical protein
MSFANDTNGVPILSTTPTGAAGVALETRATLLSGLIATVVTKADLSGATFTGSVSAQNGIVLLSNDSTGGTIQGYSTGGGGLLWAIDGSGNFSGTAAYATSAGSDISATTADGVNGPVIVSGIDSTVGGGGAGQIGFDPTTGHFYGSDGTAWHQLD